MSDSSAASSLLLNPEVFTNYSVRDAREIGVLLRTLQKQRAMFTAYIGQGPDSFITALLDVDLKNGVMMLDGSPDAELNAKACKVDTLTCSTMMDGVRIQFEVRDIDTYLHDGLEALCTLLPTSAIRLQRRAYFRMNVPMNAPVGCVIRISPEDEDAEVREIKTRVVDLSASGIGLSLPVDSGIESMQVLSDCTLTLPGSEAAPVTLRVRNVFETQSTSGTTLLRLGCEFVGLDNKLEAHIQRYLFQAERERRMLAPD